MNCDVVLKHRCGCSAADLAELETQCLHLLKPVRTPPRKLEAISSSVPWFTPYCEKLTGCCFACRFLIQILPAAVVAPLYFRNQIGFGVINQSSSAFNHILTDVSLVVYQACY